MTAGLTFREFLERDTRTFYTRADTPPVTAYPSVLRQLLASRYPTQSPVVVNSGLPGEMVTDGAGTNDVTVARFRSELSRQSPQAVLLMEGVNDLASFNHHVEQVGLVSKALGDLIRDARALGLPVFLGTLLPNDPNGCRGSRSWDLIVPANDRIKTLAGNGVILVDLYVAFGGVSGANIGFDGLHPTDAGYELMAQTFFGAIKQNLEMPR
jgi:lysophospholipase L1-like esterase